MNQAFPDGNPLVRGETSLKPQGHRNVELQDQPPYAYGSLFLTAMCRCQSLRPLATPPTPCCWRPRLSHAKPARNPKINTPDPFYSLSDSAGVNFVGRGVTNGGRSLDGDNIEVLRDQCPVSILFVFVSILICKCTCPALRFDPFPSKMIPCR